MIATLAARDLLLTLTESGEFQGMVRLLESGGTSAGTQPVVTASGLTATARTLYAALLRGSLRRPLLYVARTNREAEEICDPAETWTRLLGHTPPVFIPSHHIRPYQSPS